MRDGQHLPETWDVGEIDDETREWLPDSGKNIRWVARLGSETYGTPVVAGGKVFIGTNNHGGRVPRYPAHRRPAPAGEPVPGVGVLRQISITSLRARRPRTLPLVALAGRPQGQRRRFCQR